MAQKLADIHDLWVNGTLNLNWSGSAATIDATSTIDVTGTITVIGIFMGDD